MATWAGMSAAILASIASSGCADLSARSDRVQLEVAGPPIDADQTGQAFLYAIPATADKAADGGLLAQNWSMLGREDRAAAVSPEYAPSPCERVAGKTSRSQDIIEAIAKRAAGHRVVIINESHTVTRHRKTMRRLLPRLKRLGFTFLAIETLTNDPREKRL